MECNKTLLRINDLLTKRNWSLYKLAKESGIPYSSLNSLFQKNNQPTISTLEKICAGFNITMSDFFSIDTPSYNPAVDFTDEDMNLILTFHTLNANDRSLLIDFANLLVKRNEE